MLLFMNVNSKPTAEIATSDILDLVSRRVDHRPKRESQIGQSVLTFST